MRGVKSGGWEVAVVGWERETGVEKQKWRGPGELCMERRERGRRGRQAGSAGSDRVGLVRPPRKAQSAWWGCVVLVKTQSTER